MKRSKEPEGCVVQGKRPSAQEHEFIPFLLVAQLIEIRELGLLGEGGGGGVCTVNLSGSA